MFYEYVLMLADKLDELHTQAGTQIVGVTLNSGTWRYRGWFLVMSVLLKYVSCMNKN